MPVPVVGYSPEKGFEFGLGAIYSYYMDKDDLANRSSNFSTTLSYSTKKTYNFSIKADAWTPHNQHHLLGEIRFKNQPFYFYGIGNETQESQKDLFTFKQIKLAGEIEKNWQSHWYSGIGLSYQKESLGIQGPQPYILIDGRVIPDYQNQNLFIQVSQSLDTRNTNNYPTSGFYGKVSYQYAPKLFANAGSPEADFQGGLMRLNLRNYWSLNSKLVLGIQGMYQGIHGKNIPIMYLPQLGNDEMMRGYYSGRYRDKHLFAAQTELRYRFMNRFGAVIFAGTGHVASTARINPNQLKPNYGIGGRYFFDPAKGLSIRLDYGVGEKLPDEKRQQGFYISFAEAF